MTTIKLINTPFNYTGNKFKLLDQLIPLFDYSKDYFIDSFSGGGSVYMNVISKYKMVIVNDLIGDLIGIHKSLLESDSIIEKVKESAIFKDDKDGYLEFRNNYNENPTPEGLWALMLSCQNNMMRFNRKFKFNQSWGKRGWNSNTDKKVKEFTSHIRQYKDKLIFSSKSFKDITPNKKSMIYLDPPYLETEAGYNAYFSKKDGEDLYDYIHKVNKEGHSFGLSGVMGEHKNGKRSKLIDDLIEDGFKYKLLDISYEKAARNKNSKNSKEIYIYNY